MREICLATIDERALELAERYDLGIELDQFCTASNMDEPDIFIYDAEVTKMLPRAKVFHGPFNELSPCAIEPKVRRVSMERYDQAYCLMRHYGIRKLVLHGGFVPMVYFPEWYIERSIEFWKEFLSGKPDDFVLCLENVMEAEPYYLVKIAEGVNDPRLKLCLDSGHANVEKVSTVPVEQWLEEFSPYLGHLHLHNNDRSWDWHKPLDEGTIDMNRFLDRLDELAPEAGITFENMEGTERSIGYYVQRYT